MNAERRRAIDAGVMSMAEPGNGLPPPPLPPVDEPVRLKPRAPISVTAFEAFDISQLPDAPSRVRQLVPQIEAPERDGMLDASDELEDLTKLSLRRLREILQREVVTGEDEKQTKLTLAAAVSVVQTQVKVDEGHLKKRKLDMLPKLLEIIAQEDARRLTA